MFKNYFITAWRNITRHKLFSFINVFGLSLGITACLLIFLIGNFELSFNKGFADHEKIFRLVSDGYSTTEGESHSGSIPDPAPFILRKELNGIASLAIFSNYNATVSVHNRGVLEKFNQPERDKKPSDIVIAQPEFFNVFKYEWLAGDPATSLTEPYKVVLTQSKARLYFGERPAGEYLEKVLFYNDSLPLTISGIVKHSVPSLSNRCVRRSLTLLM